MASDFELFLPILYITCEGHVMIGKNAAGVESLAIFTDEDLAERFRTANCEPEDAVCSVQTWAEFRKLLEEQSRLGVAKVAIDAGKSGHTAIVASMKDVLENAIRMEEKGDETA
jgi:hypothetical protein